MILTVTLNAALDVTYQIGALTPGATHRVSAVAERAGGKGLNVARLLHAFGAPVTATGLLGGHTGARIAELLAADGVPGDFVSVAGESRRTVVASGAGDATGFWEPGPVITPEEWSRFRMRYDELLAQAQVVVLSGSLPRGAPMEAYGQLVAAARAAKLPVVLDADGEPLRHGLAARPTAVKPNSDELAAVVGRRPSGIPETVAAARQLSGAGAEAVVASLGADGLVLVTGPAGSTREAAGTTSGPGRSADAAWHAVAPPQRGNPTGAGDAVVTAVARGLWRRKRWSEVLVDAVALSAAAVLSPVAGTVDPAAYDRLRAQVTVTPLQPRGDQGLVAPTGRPDAQPSLDHRERAGEEN